jgi:hypothetical protein
MIIEREDLTSANRLEHGGSDESDDEVARRGQPIIVMRDLRYSLHPIGTCTDASTLGSDTKREDFGDESPGDRSTAILLQVLA